MQLERYHLSTLAPVTLNHAESRTSIDVYSTTADEMAPLKNQEHSMGIDRNASVAKF
jgi:hypothetical protein